jgi:hypothetical protein
MAEKSSWAPGKHTAENLVLFGEIERKLAKLSKTTFTCRSSSYLFYGVEASNSAMESELLLNKARALYTSVLCTTEKRPLSKYRDEQNRRPNL